MGAPPPTARMQPSDRAAAHDAAAKELPGWLVLEHQRPGP